VASRARRAKKTRTKSDVAGASGGPALRDLRAELERLKRKVDNIEAEMRRLRKPVRPAFPDVQDDESE
jgi:predicted  nucleic acid-binding Zn-ribbon protein